MKNLFAVAILLVSFATFAQSAESKKQGKLTTEQRNELRLKKMALELDLNASQQKEMAKVIARQSEKRDAARAAFKTKKEKEAIASADERYAMKSKRLDEQIALKAEMKRILNAEQYAKWEAKTAERKQKVQKKPAEHKRVKRPAHRK